MKREGVQEPSLAPRMGRVKASPVIAIADRAKDLKAAGKNVIALAQGEPDMDTPQNICEAAIRAIREGQTRYTPVDGTGALKQAILGKFSRDHGVAAKPEQVIVCTGGKQVLFNALVATIGPGDEVLIPAPHWVSYPDMVNIADGTPVILPCGEDAAFKLDARQLERAITPRTRWLILNSPSNPTGAVYSRHELQALAEVLRAHPRVMVMSDDIYEKMLYDGARFSTMVEAAPELADRILTVNGVSKTYCMTGWRIGYGVGPKWLIEAMSAIQSQSTSNPSSVSQAASVEALNGPQDFIPRNNAIFRGRRDLVVGALNDCDGLRCSVPEGAFYVYPSCEGVLGRRTPKGRRIATDFDFCEALLEEELVAVVPGTAFGLSPFFRISYATSEGILSEACQRIKRFCASLAK